MPGLIITFPQQQGPDKADAKDPREAHVQLLPEGKKDRRAHQGYEYIHRKK